MLDIDAKPLPETRQHLIGSSAQVKQFKQQVGVASA